MNECGFRSGCLVAVSLVAISSSSADALTLNMRQTEGALAGAFISVVDQSEYDSNLAVGAVTYIGELGDFTTNVSTGISQPIIGSDTVAALDLSSIDVGGAGTLQITLTDVGYDLPWSEQSAYFGIGGTANGTVTASSYADSSNTAFGMASQIGLSLLFGSGPFSSSTMEMLALGSGLFSLTTQILIEHSEFANTSFNAETTLTAVPLPPAILLLGSGLVGLGFLSRRRRRKQILGVTGA